MAHTQSAAKNPGKKMRYSTIPQSASRVALPALFLALCVSACDSPQASSGSFGQESWSLGEPTVRIGSVDDPEYAFQTVTALAMSPDGVLHSLHRGEATIRRWNREGEPLAVLGGKGEGPGEFDTPGSLGFFGDTLWVMDRRAYRVSYFDENGTFLEAVTPRVDMSRDPDNPNASVPRPSLPLRDGTIYGIAPAWSDAIARGQLSEAKHVHMDQSGEHLGTVWNQPYRETDVLALLREGGGTFGRQPFGDQALFHVSTDGFLLVLHRRVSEGSDSSAVRITRITMAGDTVFSKEIPYIPEPLPRSKVDSAVHAQAEGMHQFMQRMDPELSLGKLEADIGEATYSPDYLPAIRNMTVAEDGTIWLERFTPTEEGIEWWILDGQGEPLATVSTPEGLRVLLITQDAVWGVETDEFDVNYIVRYGLDRS